MTGIYENSLSLSLISVAIFRNFPHTHSDSLGNIFIFKFFSFVFIYLLPSQCHFALCLIPTHITNLQNWYKWLATIIASPHSELCAATTNVSLIGTINIIIMQICTNYVDNDDGSSRTFRVKFSDVRALCVFIFLVRSLLVQAYVFVRINICTTKFWK